MDKTFEEFSSPDQLTAHGLTVTGTVVGLGAMVVVTLHCCCFTYDGVGGHALIWSQHLQPSAHMRG